MQNELLKEARTIVEERRSSVVLGIKGEPSREGVFQWVDGAPTAGRSATLAYNANSGPLRNAQVYYELAPNLRGTRQASCTHTLAGRSILACTMVRQLQTAWTEPVCS